MTSRFKPTEPSRPKTAGEQVKDMAVYMLVMGAVYFVFYFLFLAITWPFRMLFRSPRQSFQANLDQMKVKVTKRTLARKAYDSDESNPLFQYVERFRLHPELYQMDQDSNQYQEWFENMKSGKILDTKLNWAPEVYCNLNDNLFVSGEFLDYFSRQVELHQAESFRSQVHFLRTVRNLYPEFTPEFSKIPKEIEGYRDEVKCFELQEELIQTIGGKGISKKLAEELVSITKSSEELKQAILTVKECEAKGFGEEMSLYCIRYGYNPNHERADEVNLLIKEMGNVEIASAIARGVIKMDELVKISKNAYERGGSKERILNRINESFKDILRGKCQAELCGGKI